VPPRLVQRNSNWATRWERPKELPAEALYGIDTSRFLEDFPSSRKTIGEVPELVSAMAIVKQAAARTNVEIGALGADHGQAIFDAAEEVRAGKHKADLLADVLAGTGGTVINMNFNEVIANLAAVRSGQPRCANWRNRRPPPADG
jgi:aspartate ammonia-lyase